MIFFKMFVICLAFTGVVSAHEVSLIRYQVNQPTEKAMALIGEKFEVLLKTSTGYEVYVPENKVREFLKLAPGAKIINEHLPQKLNSLTGYRSMASVILELKDIEAKYPEIAKLETYGKTASGHALYALKISDNVNTDEEEPELMITSATHGDELITVEVSMNLFQTVLQNYKKDPRLTKFIDEREIYFIPVVNPQGYSKQSRYAGNIDPNRDYPFPGREDKLSVDCIDALIKWFHSRNIVGSLDIHASGKMVMFPWAYTKQSVPDEEKNEFQNLVDRMAEINKYKAGPISQVIYVAKGSSADYYYWKNKTTAIAAELTTTKIPPAKAIPQVTEEAREMVWRFIEHF